MTYTTVVNQIVAANTMLERLNAPFRLSLMSQNYNSRITIEFGTPEQLERGTCTNASLSGATLHQAGKFMQGFNACLKLQITYALPCNQPKTIQS